MPKYSLEGDMAVFGCKEMVFIGVHGHAPHSLAEINVARISDGRTIEFGALKNWSIEEYDLEVRAGFQFNPFIDVTLTRHPQDSAATIITYSLDKRASQLLIEDIIEATGFRSHNPPMDFIEGIGDQSLGKCTNYLTLRKKYTCDELVRRTSFSHYYNFLRLYSGLEQNRIVAEAKTKFNFP